jgi:Glycosyl hydrolases family 25
MTDPIWVADISNWQGGIDASQIVREGYAAVVCKASEGTTFTDPDFVSWVNQIRSANGIPGAYHYIRAGNGAGQAHHFLDCLSKVGGPSGMIIQLDVEADSSWQDIQDFSNTWNAETGNHKFLIYTGQWWWGPRGWNGASITPYLWHSHYVSGPADFGSAMYGRVDQSWWTPGYGGWSTATMLQFTSQALVAGQKVDVSAFRGSLDELKALAGPGTPPPPPPSPSGLTEDGVLGPRSISAWQHRMGTPVDGMISSGYSNLVAAVQRYLNTKGAGLSVDGVGIRQDGRSVFNTTRALQRYLGTPADGVLSLPSSEAVRKLQHRLNSGTF